LIGYRHRGDDRMTARELQYTWQNGPSAPYWGHRLVSGTLFGLTDPPLLGRIQAPGYAA
jgi:hypothetical protein